MRVKLYKRKGKTGSTLYLHITAPGQPRIRERLDIQLTGEKEADRERLHQAKHIRAIREAQLLAGKYNIESTLGESLSFIEYFGKLAMTRHRTWKSTQNHLITFCGSRNPMLKDIDESWLESFKKYLLAPAATSGAVLNANTAGIYFSKIKAALNIALRSRLIHRNPGSIVAGIAKEDVQRNYLTMVELRTLSDSECPNDGVKNAFLFACYTGLRYCDIIGLRWKDVRNNQLEVRQKKTKSLVYIPL